MLLTASPTAFLLRLEIFKTYLCLLRHLVIDRAYALSLKAIFHLLPWRPSNLLNYRDCEWLAALDSRLRLHVRCLWVGNPCFSALPTSLYPCCVMTILHRASLFLHNSPVPVFVVGDRCKWAVSNDREHCNARKDVLYFNVNKTTSAYEGCIFRISKNAENDHILLKSKALIGVSLHSPSQRKQPLIITCRKVLCSTEVSFSCVSSQSCALASPPRTPWHQTLIERWRLQKQSCLTRCGTIGRPWWGRQRTSLWWRQNHAKLCNRHTLYYTWRTHASSSPVAGGSGSMPTIMQT